MWREAILLVNLIQGIVSMDHQNSSLSSGQTGPNEAGVGRLLEPPSRGSMWRVGVFAPQDDEDAKNDCGGFTRMWRSNRGRCGVCGDPYDLPTPRPHEDGGQFGRGIISRHYAVGQDIEVKIELLNNRRGHFEVELCPDTDCLDILALNQTTSFEPSFLVPKAQKAREIFRLSYILPENLTCDHCVIRWRYFMASHVWPCLDEGRLGHECGPQLEARACADVAIGLEDHNESMDLLAGLFDPDLEADPPQPGPESFLENMHESWIEALHSFQQIVDDPGDVPEAGGHLNRSLFELDVGESFATTRNSTLGLTSEGQVKGTQSQAAILNSSEVEESTSAWSASPWATTNSQELGPQLEIPILLPPGRMSASDGLGPIYQMTNGSRSNNSLVTAVDSTPGRAQGQDWTEIEDESVSSPSLLPNLGGNKSEERVDPRTPLIFPEDNAIGAHTAEPTEEPRGVKFPEKEDDGKIKKEKRRKRKKIKVDTASSEKGGDEAFQFEKLTHSYSPGATVRDVGLFHQLWTPSLMVALLWRSNTFC